MKTASSALPYRRAPPSWLKTSPEDVVEQIIKFARKGLTPSQIGVTLRDSHGIPQVRFVTGNKILRILKSHGALLLFYPLHILIHSHFCSYSIISLAIFFIAYYFTHIPFVWGQDLAHPSLRTFGTSSKRRLPFASISKSIARTRIQSFVLF